MNNITQIIFEHLPINKKLTPSGWYSFNCPMCIHKGHKPDTRSRGGFILSNDGGFSYNCFNCTFKTKWNPGSYFNSSNINLAEALNIPNDAIKTLKLNSLREAENEQYETNENFKIYSLPKNSISLKEGIEKNLSDKNFLNVLEYIYNRNPNLINWYDFYWSNETEYNINKRIIIPVCIENKIVGWNGRIVKEHMKPKYIAQVNKNTLFNVNVVNKPIRKYLFITEGVFDAISIDCVATMKSVLSDHQIQTLNSSKAFKIIVPDKDNSGRELVEQGLDHEYYVSFPKWKFKDISEAVENYGRLPVLKHLINNVLTSPLKINLESKYYFQ